MSVQNREQAILEEVRKTLVSEGYEVVVQPSKLLIPEFLEGFQPDALAFRSDKNLIVEVATQSPAAGRRLRQLQELLGSQRDWDLRLVWSAPGERARSLQKVSGESIDLTIQEIEKLASMGHYRPALLLGWASLEALGRLTNPSSLSRPQSPARLVEQIASDGYLAPSEADAVRDLISKRNRLVHGELQTDVRRKDIFALISALKQLREAVKVKAHLL